MTDDKPTPLSLRLPAQLVERIDQAAAIESERTGYHITRTEFCRAALAKACAEVEARTPPTGSTAHE